jgi:acyl carrier protein
MDFSKIEEMVQLEVAKCLRKENPILSIDTTLIGPGGVFDSILLIELCVALEDRSSELGFEFDWTSDSAMSRSRSVFTTVGSLAIEFHRQMEASS